MSYCSSGTPRLEQCYRTAQRTTLNAILDSSTRVAPSGSKHDAGDVCTAVTVCRRWIDCFFKLFLLCAASRAYRRSHPHIDYVCYIRMQQHSTFFVTFSIVGWLPEGTNLIQPPVWLPCGDAPTMTIPDGCSQKKRFAKIGNLSRGISDTLPVHLVSRSA